MSNNIYTIATTSPSLNNALVHLVDASYVFDITSTNTVGITKIATVPLSGAMITNGILDASDVTFLRVPTGFTIGGVLIEAGGVPLVYIGTSIGLPFVSSSGDVVVSWSNDPGKIANFVSRSVNPKAIIKAQVSPITQLAGVGVNRNEDIVLARTERQPTSPTYTFRDMSISFTPHPLTGDIVRVYDGSAVAQSIKNILFTDRTERPFSNITLGGNIRKLLFSMMDSGTIMTAESDIITTIVQYEPRALVLKVELKPYPELNAVEVIVAFKVKTFNKVETISVYLKRA